MTFHVGQKVECIDDSPDRLGRPIIVTKGAKYTITDIFERAGQVGVLLAEIDPGQAPGWHARRFRAIVERKTDISIFTQMLTPQRIDA